MAISKDNMCFMIRELIDQDLTIGYVCRFAGPVRRAIEGIVSLTGPFLLMEEVGFECHLCAD